MASRTGTWKRIGPINRRTNSTPSSRRSCNMPTARLQVLCRTKESVIATSFSEDGGETWSKMEATNLPNPNSGIEVVTLNDGRHLLIYNHLGSGKTGWGRRGMLNLAISEDGQTWRKVGRAGTGRKGRVQLSRHHSDRDGLVHMTYTWKRQRIKHVVVDPAKIQAGTELSREAWHSTE